MIYFIQPENGGPVKIGLAKNPKSRAISIQVNHYERLILRCVMEGDRVVEEDLHRRFAYCWRIGEWFEPTEDLLAFMATLTQLNWRPVRGRELGEHSHWKGEGANVMTKRARAQRRFQLGPCERCGRAAYDRKCRDGNHDNLSPENIAFYCRRCSMIVDGRLSRMAAIRKFGPPSTPPKPCSNCGKPWKPLRKGRCHTCATYFIRKGIERPRERFASPAHDDCSSLMF